MTESALITNSLGFGLDRLHAAIDVAATIAKSLNPCIEFPPPSALRPPSSADLPRLPLEEIHENELAERHRRREVRLAAADRRHVLHELDQRSVPREHERVDHDSAPPAFRDFAERLVDHRR